MSTTNMHLHLNLTGGDDRFELDHQLPDIGRVDARSRPPFKVKAQRIRNAWEFGLAEELLATIAIGLHVRELGSLDGSGDYWRIGGVITRETLQRIAWLGRAWPITRKFTGEYNTHTRRGFIQPVRLDFRLSYV